VNLSEWKSLRPSAAKPGKTSAAPQAFWGPEGRRGVRERHYWQAVKRRALERPVVEGEAGSRIHHWAQTVSPGTMPAEA
jgi:hypothetical protein